MRWPFTIYDLDFPIPGLPHHLATDAPRALGGIVPVQAVLPDLVVAPQPSNALLLDMATREKRP